MKRRAMAQKNCIPLTKIPNYLQTFKEIAISLTNFDRQELLNFICDAEELIYEAKRLLSVEISQIAENIPKEVWKEILMKRIVNDGDAADEAFLIKMTCVSKTISQAVDEIVPVIYRGREYESDWILFKCTHVEVLKLRDMYVPYEDDLKRYTNLKELTYAHKIGNDFTARPLENITSLTKLSLKYCEKVTNDALMKLTSLRTLDIRQNSVNYFEALKSLPHLDTLQLDELQPWLQSKENLRKLTNLTSLEFRFLCESTQYEYPLCRLPHLRTLILGRSDGDFYVENFHFGDFVKFSPDITTLIINTFDIFIRDQDLKQFKNLTSLSVKSLFITNESVKKLTNLAKLDISFCKLVDDNGIMGLRSLTDLHVNANISEECLKNFPNLTRLDLKRVFTYRQLRSVLMRQSDEYKYERCNRRISNVGLSYLKNLRYLSFDATCNKVINVKNLKKIFPELEIDSRSYEEILSFQDEYINW